MKPYRYSILTESGLSFDWRGKDPLDALKSFIREAGADQVPIGIVPASCLVKPSDGPFGIVIASVNRPTTGARPSKGKRGKG